MENASRALIMAGTILISVVILSILVILIRNGGNVSQSYDSKLSEEELKAYNAKFEKFCTTNEEVNSKASNSYILASDVVTLVNKAKDVNNNYNNPSYDHITVNIYLPDLHDSITNEEWTRGMYVYSDSVDSEDDSDSILGIKGSKRIYKNKFLELCSGTYIQDKPLEYYYMARENNKGINYSYKFQCSITKYSDISGKVTEITIKYME